MVNMRVKIDVWTKGMTESHRNKVRENLRDLFCELPVRRLWFYLKQLRIMRLNDKSGPWPSKDIDEIDEHMDGPEDVIARGHYFCISRFSVAGILIASSKQCHSAREIMSSNAFDCGEAHVPPEKSRYRISRRDEHDWRF